MLRVRIRHNQKNKKSEMAGSIPIDKDPDWASRVISWSSFFIIIIVVVNFKSPCLC